MNGISAQQVAALATSANTVGAFLAQCDFPEARLDSSALHAALGVQTADLLVLCGNSVLHTGDCACAAVRDGLARHLLISGGIGHSTQHLYDALRSHPRYSVLSTAGRSEAELFGEIATRFWKIGKQQITLETASTNCGENAAFTFNLIRQSRLEAASLVLVQDPTMQRRSDATFRKVWRDAGAVLNLANYPAFIPLVRASGDSLVFAAPVPGLWTIERFLSLLLGEIPRLLDNEQGYGPNGRGYIEHVDIPQNVLHAYCALRTAFPELMRTI